MKELKQHILEKLTDSIQIENTKELYDIFGEEALHKIYDYIVNH